VPIPIPRRDPTGLRWVQCFKPFLIDEVRLCRHAPGDRWFADETYVEVAGRWHYVYSDSTAICRFATCGLRHSTSSTAVSTDQALAYLWALDELLSGACHVMEKYAIIRSKPATAA
jgi:transposase, IS6 family